MFSSAKCARAALKRSIGRHFATASGPKRGDSVVVGMSGGVDSSVAARLLADKDYNLSAVYMRNWDTRDETASDRGCEWEKDWNDVQRVCKILDIPCQMIDLSRQYWNRVFEPALRIWESGNTPNPDVWCNREIKFGALLEHLPDKTAWFATGHYARKAWTPSTPSRPLLLRAADPIKDQTYYLSSISEAGLARALFPLGDYTKAQVRDLARQYELPTAERAESMGLCFVGEKTRFSNFISSYIPPNPGPIVREDTGKRVGTHQGLWTFTIGENARVQGMPQKMYVSDKDEAINTIYVVPGVNNPRLFRNSIRVCDWQWIWADAPFIRHRQEEVPCTVIIDENGMLVNIDRPEPGVALGQVLVVWDEAGVCLGCGLVASADYAE
ncbi:5-methylaminomethyl-2-thiouridylate-methyltransferase [Hymenopellis radicata]|nr:5-methylaminomethyl-2-thiouridylate-methyltransferase [Hymenopellis radicata]